MLRWVSGHSGKKGPMHREGAASWGLVQGERSGRRPPAGTAGGLRPEPPPCTTPSFRLEGGGCLLGVFRGCCGWGGLALFCRKRLEQAGLAEGLHGGDFRDHAKINSDKFR